MVRINIGKIPAENNLEIKAMYGYDSYKELLEDKLIVGIEADYAKIKTPSPKP